MRLTANEQHNSTSPSLNEDEGVIEIEPLGLEVYEE